jgi:hypothetical protein
MMVTVKVRRTMKVIDDAQVNELGIYEKKREKEESKNRSIAAGGTCVAKPDISKTTLES